MPAFKPARSRKEGGFRNQLNISVILRTNSSPRNPSHGLDKPVQDVQLSPDCQNLVRETPFLVHFTLSVQSNPSDCSCLQWKWEAQEQLFGAFCPPSRFSPCSTWIWDPGKRWETACKGVHKLPWSHRALAICCSLFTPFKRCDMVWYPGKMKFKNCESSWCPQVLVWMWMGVEAQKIKCLCRLFANICLTSQVCFRIPGVFKALLEHHRSGEFICLHLSQVQLLSQHWPAVQTSPKAP